MTSGDQSRSAAQPGTAQGPGDVPSAHPPSLARLDALVGEWEMEVSFEAGYFGPGSPPVNERGGRTTFEWLDGRFFMIQRFSVGNPSAPSGIAIIGVGAEPETFSQHYYDSRGVARVYQMSLEHGVLRLWREAPGFWQRYSGVFADDGQRIDGAWQASPDGVEWKHDFHLNYLKTA